MKKYAEGGDYGLDFQPTMPRKGGYGGPQDEGDEEPKKQSFKDAFAEARKGGGKTFEWQGKKYTTEMAKPKAKEATPAAKPADKYETPVDRYARKNRDTAQSEEAMSKNKPRRGRMVGDTEVDTNTLLPKKYAKGGSVSGRADGIASKGKTNCKIV